MSEIWNEETVIKKVLESENNRQSQTCRKKATIPGYGKKGVGWIKNPKKAAYNKVYKKTTFSIMDVFKK